VIEATARTLDQPVEFVGTVEASRRVEVRAQVAGVILARPYTEGSAVQPGQVLFRIDPTQYEAASRSARGRAADAQARLNNAERNLARLRPLAADSAVPRRDLDDAIAEQERATAGLEDARGDVDRTKKDLDETQVRAMLPGRVGRALLQLGARVTGPNDVLTTIDALDPIYVTFRPTERQLIGWRRDSTARKNLAPGGSVQVELTLPDGRRLPRTGKIEFVDPTVDPTTGTEQYRASFTNPDRLLVPGTFVRVRLLGLTRPNAITVPERAILQTLGKQFVYVVGRGDSVAARDVETGPYTEGIWLVEKGLTPGDRVVVDGIQKIRPGQVVKPTPLPEGTK
jgi:membrane fusion protein (multidrug efflux system)